MFKLVNTLQLPLFGQGQRGHPSLPQPLKTMSVVVVGLMWLSATTMPVVADDWMFRRSYFSHVWTGDAPPPFPQPESRTAYREAYYRQAPGISFRSAWRWNNYVIQNGPRWDRTFYREGYLEFEP